MDQQKKSRLLRIAFLILRSFVVYLIFALFSLCSDFIIRLYNYDERGHYFHLPDFAVYVTGFVFSILFYYAFVRINAANSNTFRARFLAAWDRNDTPGLLRRLKFAFCSPELYSDLAVHALLVLIFPSEFGFQNLVALLGDYGEKGFVILILIPALALLCILAYTSALSSWTVQWSRKIKKPDLKDIPFWKLPVSILLIGLFFLTICAFAPLVIRSLYTVFQILQLVNPLVSIPIIVGFIPLWCLIRLLIAFFKRIRFLRLLRKICKANGYELIQVKKCFRTLIIPQYEANLILKKGDVRYECRFISSLGRHSPLFFREEGTVTCTHVFRLMALNLFAFDFTYDYQFESTGTKILILLPAPIEVLISGYGVTQLAEPGSRIADCRIYGATDFLHALERDVIEK